MKPEGKVAMIAGAGLLGLSLFAGWGIRYVGRYSYDTGVRSGRTQMETEMLSGAIEARAVTITQAKDGTFTWSWRQDLHPQPDIDAAVARAIAAERSRNSDASTTPP